MKRIRVICSEASPNIVMSRRQRDWDYAVGINSPCSKSGSEDSVESSIPTAFREEDNEDRNSRNSRPGQQQQRNPSTLGRKETKAVRWLKGIVLTVLLVAAIIVCVVTHNFTRDKEVETFENQFLDDSARLKLAYYEVSAQRIWVSTSLIVRLITQSAITFSSITEQVLFDFDYSGISLLHLSRSESIACVPVIKSSDRRDWESFAASSQLWSDPFGEAPKSDDIRPIAEGIWKLDDDYQAVDEVSPGDGANASATPIDQEFLAPMWQVTPLSVRRKSVMFNLLSEPVRRKALTQMIVDKVPTITGLLQDATEEALRANFTSTPRSISLFPVTDVVNNYEFAGVVALEWRWAAAFENILQDESAAVMIVIESSLGDETFTLEVVGSSVNYVGKGDHHDPRFDDLGSITSFGEFEKHFEATQIIFQQPQGLSEYLTIEHVRAIVDGGSFVLHFYPTSRFEESFTSNRPAVYTSAVLMIFVFTTLVFIVYDYLVERRQSVVMESAVKHTSLVHELYPPEFVNRVMQPHDKRASTLPKGEDQTDDHSRFRLGSNRKMNVLQPIHSPQTILTDSCSSRISTGLSQPIAEIYPDVTVIFADICGFTAWSSEREPIQVFQLLESLFGAFDEAGKRLGVFKVETIGDCYVAVTGLPEPHSSHAVVMCRFANEIQLAMKAECKKLEVLLGPGTSELKVRIGLHSGPVIAGVLRGEKARFQLFGDSMNTCARIESTGQPGKTHVSKATADLLIAAGKRYWVTPRSEVVEAKGKGQLQTFWMIPRRKASMRQKRPTQQTGYNPSDKDRIEEEDKMTTSDTASFASGEWGKLSVDGDCFGHEEDGKQDRLIDWNTEMLVPMLNQLVARRAKSEPKKDVPHPGLPSFERQPFEKLFSNADSSIETVQLPSFDPAHFKASVETWILVPTVRQQLRNFIADIAARYNELPFHNFEHASHVTLSSVKLLNRIAAVDGEHWDQELAAQRHKETFGIATDPLTHFVVVLAALIHDVGHPGVPNSQLLAENHELCQTYGVKNIAERHSIHIALQMLQQYPDLQECIYSTPEEHDRFHQLLYHSVLSTDIIDSDSTLLWKIAFGPEASQGGVDEQTLMNRRASIVLEQIIQASDVAHTMQHWHIYRKWNEMLFHEFYDAFKEGSTSYDPRNNWYEGELGFLDNYVLPLAKRLKESGVYGVSSEEYFQHALANREEWELKGQAVTEAMIEGLAERQKLGPEPHF